MLYADAPPLADAAEQQTWLRARRGHELLSRPSQWTGFFGPTGFMDKLSSIPPLYSEKDLTRPSLGTRVLEFLIERGLGRGLIAHLKQTDAALLTTFYAPAIVADHARHARTYCVATDADINRIWVPSNGRNSLIHYFAPSTRVLRRLEAYGVARERITLTGFPLPLELLGGPELPTLRHDVARRLVRLDPQRRFRELYQQDLERALGPLPSSAEGAPVHLVFAVGGAGAQAEMAFEFLPSLSKAILNGRVKVTLAAGTRLDVVQTFERAIAKAKLGSAEPKVEILHAPDFLQYYRRFNQLLRETDILWTKPSELSFYAALGLALVLAKPVGSHEHFNLRWLREQGVGLKQNSPRYAGYWLEEWLSDGTLAAAAWSGFARLPKDGTYAIARHLAEAGR